MKNILYPLLLLFFFSGCASTGFLMSRAQVVLFAEAYQAKPADSKIDIYITNKPTQEYSEFAKITCRDTNDKWCIEQISKKALQIGADAIIIAGKAGSAGVGIPIGNTTYVATENYGMTAIAIKYK
jgi:hypothetical protein